MHVYYTTYSVFFLNFHENTVQLNFSFTASPEEYEFYLLRVDVFETTQKSFDQ